METKQKQATAHVSSWPQSDPESAASPRRAPRSVRHTQRRKQPQPCQSSSTLISFSWLESQADANYTAPSVLSLVFFYYCCHLPVYWNAPSLEPDQSALYSRGVLR